MLKGFLDISSLDESPSSKNDPQEGEGLWRAKMVEV